MNKQEYKQLSHDIRLQAYKDAKRKNTSTRSELHNVLFWHEGFFDKVQGDIYRKTCIGDYDIGLVWNKRF